MSKHQASFLTTQLGIGHLDESYLVDKYLNEQSQFVNIDGLEIHYRLEGEGQPIVLLHGVMSSLHTWDDWTQELVKTHQVIRLDLPGFGFSDYREPPLEHAIDFYLSILHQFFKRLNLESFYLAGNSMGGLLGFHYAAKYPENILKLIMIDPVSYPQNPPLSLTLGSLPIISHIAQYMVPKYIFELNVLETYGRRQNIKPGVLERYFELTMRKGNKKSMVSVFKLLKAYSRDPNISKPIQQLTMPILLMWGERDRWISKKFVQRWEQDASNVSAIIYEKVGHMPMEEAPQATLQDVLNFI